MSKLEQLLQELLEKSVNKCYECDEQLIRRGMEQASVARIYYYMQDFINNDKKYSIFIKYDLDCEYYRNGDNLKFTVRRPHGTRPDMILHKRGSNLNNKLIVEFKSNSNDNVEMDFIKLEDFTKNGEYTYSLGAFVRLYSNEPEFTYFLNGSKVGENNE